MQGSKLVDIIKQSAKLPPSEIPDMLIGQVTSVSPLRVKIDNRYEIDEDFILLTSAVQDFEVEMTVDHVTEQANAHAHGYKGIKKFKVHLALEVGEKVLALRVQNGQKFVIIDRLR